MTRVLSTNVTGVHLVTQAFLPLLEKGNLKKIVNVYVQSGSSPEISVDKSQDFNNGLNCSGRRLRVRPVPGIQSLKGSP